METMDMIQMIEQNAAASSFVGAVFSNFSIMDG